MELGHILEKSELGAKYGCVSIPALFFADDIVLIGEDTSQLEKLLGVFGNERKLEFSPRKSKVMVNWRNCDKDMEWDIGGAKIKEAVKYGIRNSQCLVCIGECEEYKYLGITVKLRGKIFRIHEKNKISSIKRKGGLVRIFARGSLNEALCAKIAWESIVLPHALYGSEAVNVTKAWISDLEKENLKMARYITGASKSCSKEGIYGELGWLKMKDKLAQAKLVFVKRLMNTTDEWLKSVFEQAKKIQTNWWIQVKEWLSVYKINLDMEIGKKINWENYIKKQIKKQSFEEWKKEKNNRVSLRFMSQEYPRWGEYLNGTKGGTNLFKLRTGDWDVWEKRKHWDRNGLEKCRLCNNKTETMEHVIGECPMTVEERRKLGIMKDTIDTRVIADALDVWKDGDLKLKRWYATKILSMIKTRNT